MNGICYKTTQLKKKVKISLPSIPITDSYVFKTVTPPHRTAHSISPEFESHITKRQMYFSLYESEEFLANYLQQLLFMYSQ